MNEKTRQLILGVTFGCHGIYHFHVTQLEHKTRGIDLVALLLIIRVIVKLSQGNALKQIVLKRKLKIYCF